MTQWINTAIAGLVCGAIARFLLPGRDSIGWIMTMLVGIAGAYVGSFIGQSLGKLGKGQAAGWMWSIIGSMALLIVLRFVT